MSFARLALRTWVRYVGPFAALGVLAAAPAFWLLFKLAPTIDPAHARIRLFVGIALAVVAWSVQLAVVAAVAPAMRALARGAPLSQGRALVDGARSLVRALVPTCVALAAVAIGGVALVIPGLVLLVLLALTGASEQLGAPLPAALVDSVAAVRPQLARVAAIVAIALVVDLAIADGGQLALLGAVAKKPNAAQLAAMRLSTYVPVALAAISPIVACALAACYRRERA